MAKILSFRAKAKAADGAGSEQDFLHHEDHTLSFQVTETGSMGLSNLLDHRIRDAKTPVCNDWSNQELADLYRVKRLLDAAGVPNDLDRGITDEGDPWLVFCGPDGEVFIHLCRLDALYVLDSPNIQTPLRGSNFNDLIEAFTNRALPRTGAESGTDSRVIRLERGGKVYLHPSALLAALIWTLFLAAEEIVLMMPDEEQATDGLADLNALTFGDGAQDAPDLPIVVSENTIPVEELTARTSTDNDPRHVAAHEAFLRDNGSSGLTMTQNSYGMGLSTIAIAFGFMAEQALSDAEQAAGADILAGDISDTADDDGDPRSLAENKLQKMKEGDSEAETVELAQLSDAEDRVLEDGTAQAALDASETLAETTAFLQDSGDKGIETRIWVDTASEGELPQEITLTAEAKLPAEAPQNTEAMPSTSENNIPLPALFTLSTLRTIFDLYEVEFREIGSFAKDTVAQASLDLTDSDLGAAQSFLEQEELVTSLQTDVGNIGSSSIGFIDLPEPTISAAALPSFDVNAQAYVRHLMEKSGEIEAIDGSAVVTLIDHTATDFYAMSWALYEGGVLSIIGTRSEMQEFDLIA
tara:strand:+ start:662 stop:2410 length:1749 start_codon:yes stop_codon:yes gene_type:complete